MNIAKKYTIDAAKMIGVVCGVYITGISIASLIGENAPKSLITFIQPVVNFIAANMH